MSNSKRAASQILDETSASTPEKSKRRDTEAEDETDSPLKKILRPLIDSQGSEPALDLSFPTPSEARLLIISLPDYFRFSQKKAANFFFFCHAG